MKSGERFARLNTEVQLLQRFAFKVLKTPAVGLNMPEVWTAKPERMTQQLRAPRLGSQLSHISSKLPATQVGENI